MFRTASVIVLAVLLGSAGNALAFELEPISRVFDPSGSKATQSFEIYNSSNERIAVEVSVATLERDIDYRESSRPAGDDFLVYPSQVIVPAGGRQTVRVKWLGDPDPDTELSYRLIAEQLPIELAIPGARRPAVATGKVRVLLTYRGSLYIRPRGARARVALAKIEQTRTSDGSEALAVTMTNSGTRHAVLGRCKGSIQSSSPASKVALTGQYLQPLAHSKILAGDSRRYLLPWPAAVPAGSVSATVRCALLPQ